MRRAARPDPRRIFGPREAKRLSGDPYVSFLPFSLPYGSSLQSFIFPLVLQLAFFALFSFLLAIARGNMNRLRSVWLHRIRLRIELAMEYQINHFNGIPYWLFGCVWYSHVESRLQWNSKSCLVVHCVELTVFLTLNNINYVI
jgi:hypothetical protein